jgi:hypothetical protein
MEINHSMVDENRIREKGRSENPSRMLVRLLD